MENEAKQFAGRVEAMLGGAFPAMGMGLGVRLGLFDALLKVEEPVTSQQLADQMHYKERYVREWLSIMTCADIVQMKDEEPLKFYIAKERAPAFAELCPLARAIPLLSSVTDDVTDCFKQDGALGIPYSRYPELGTFMAGIRKLLTSEHIYKLADASPGLREKLEAGAKILDVGCSSGQFAILVGKTFKNCQVVGFDIDEESIKVAKDEAQKNDVTNVQFEIHSIYDLPADWKDSFDYVIIRDVVHDLAYPDKALKQVYNVVKDGGILSVIDINTESDLASNRAIPEAPMFYTFSLFHCMAVSLFFEGGAGYGTCMGRKVALALLEESGFKNTRKYEKHQMGWDAHYVAEK